MTQQATPDSLCNHAGCNCEVDESATYCGDYCRKEPQVGMEAKDLSCRCGHEACGSPSDPSTRT